MNIDTGFANHFPCDQPSRTFFVFFILSEFSPIVSFFLLLLLLLLLRSPSLFLFFSFDIHVRGRWRNLHVRIKSGEENEKKKKKKDNNVCTCSKKSIARAVFFPLVFFFFTHTYTRRGIAAAVVFIDIVQPLGIESLTACSPCCDILDNFFVCPLGFYTTDDNNASMTYNEF